MTHKERIITKKIFIKGTIKTLTGLHIGGADTGINIGGIDKGAVVRNSITNEPYIPGSSLKGKMRSLLEKLRGEYEIDDRCMGYNKSDKILYIITQQFSEKFKEE